MITTKDVKARKDHECDFCGLKISKGDVYENQFNKNDGYIYTWKSHLHCKKIVSVLGMYDDGDGITQENFIESVYGFLAEEKFKTIEEAMEIMKEKLNIK